MPSCVMRSCGNKMKKSAGVTYHKFPSDELLRLEWVQIVRKERNQINWKPSKKSAICSAHFDSKYKYIGLQGFILLKKSAVPILQEDPDVSQAPKNVSSQHQQDSPNSLKNEDIPKMASSVDSYALISLRKHIDRLTSEKKELQRMNYFLRKRNDRIKAKNIKMHSIHKKLKNKIILIEEQVNELNLEKVQRNP